MAYSQKYLIKMGFERSLVVIPYFKIGEEIDLTIRPIFLEIGHIILKYLKLPFFSEKIYDYYRYSVTVL